MKIIILIFITYLSLNNLLIAQSIKKYQYWENMNPAEKEQFLSSHQIDKLALQFYNGKFTVSDNNISFKFLKILTTKSSNLIPFYNYLFNKICYKADGALSETLGKYCFRMIINNTDYVINYFTYDRENKKSNKYCYQLYGNILGYEMYFKKEGTSDIDYNFGQLKEYLNNHFKKGSTQNKKTLKLLYNVISSTIKNMSK